MFLEIGTLLVSLKKTRPSSPEQNMKTRLVSNLHPTGPFFLLPHWKRLRGEESVPLRTSPDWYLPTEGCRPLYQK